MREKAALYLLLVSVVLIIGIDITPYAFGEGQPWLGYLESTVDAATVVLIYFLLKRELTFRTRVLNMAAHDLRNPLGVIRGYSELILDKTAPPEMERELLQKIHAKSEEMLQLVGDLLDTAVIDRRQLKLDKQVSPLGELIQSVIVDFQIQLARKNQKIKVSGAGDLVVSVDRSRLRQVLANLVSNAIKYSSPNSEIAVEVSDRGDFARVAVRDQGPGLSRAEKDLIFDSFTRVKKPTTGGESSTGLGLSISKSLVEMNGGRLWVESDGVGLGSTFIVEIPSA